MITLALVFALLITQPAPVRVVFETTLGEIVIEVNVVKAPITSANFLRYVDGGWYDDGRFHRTVRPETETNTTQSDPGGAGLAQADRTGRGACVSSGGAGAHA